MPPHGGFLRYHARGGLLSLSQAHLPGIGSKSDEAVVDDEIVQSLFLSAAKPRPWKLEQSMLLLLGGTTFVFDFFFNPTCQKWLTSKCFLFTVHPKTVVFPTTFSGCFLGVNGFSCGQTPQKTWQKPCKGENTLKVFG